MGKSSIKTDSLLNKIWQKHIPGNATCQIGGLKATKDGGVVFITVKQNDNNLSQDAYFMKIGPNGEVTSRRYIGKIKSRTFKVFPYPATNFINLSLENPATKFKQIIIYDINSKEVKNINNPINNKLDIENLNSGSYFVKAIDSEGNVFSAKFIKK